MNKIVKPTYHRFTTITNNKSVYGSSTVCCLHASSKCNTLEQRLIMWTITHLKEIKMYLCR